MPKFKKEHRMKKNTLYIIEGKTYLNHINDEVHLYGLLHQLAFLAGRIKDEEDVFHVLDAAKRYGEIARRSSRAGASPALSGVRRPQGFEGAHGQGTGRGGGRPEEEPKPKKYRDEYIIPGRRLPYAGGRHPPPDRPLPFAGPPPVRGGDGEGLSPLEKAGRQL